MPRDDLIAAGEALYGPRWQTDVARLLNIDDRRVRQWLAGARPIPPGIWPELAAELRRRAGHAEQLASMIEKACVV